MGFGERLKGGHPNSLGNTSQIVEEVLDDVSLFDRLFNCYFDDDEVVRLRVSNAMKRICKERKSMLVPYIDRFLEDISKIDQASARWTLAQLFLRLQDDMDEGQMGRAVQILKHNLTTQDDWIVLNQTMETLGAWSQKDEDLKKWLAPHLKRLLGDRRKSVAKKALKTMNHMEK